MSMRRRMEYQERLMDENMLRIREFVTLPLVVPLLMIVKAKVVGAEKGGAIPEDVDSDDVSALLLILSISEYFRGMFKSLNTLPRYINRTMSRSHPPHTR
jgi:hypothetical protein